ncbi:MAG: hypothetical protein N2C14_26950, partial [Planctomycetales bacterium]
ACLRVVEQTAFGTHFAEVIVQPAVIDAGFSFSRSATILLTGCKYLGRNGVLDSISAICRG